MPEYMLVATIVSDVPEYKIAQIEDKPRQMPIGIPRIRKIKNEIKRIALIIFLLPPNVYYIPLRNTSYTLRLLSALREQRLIVNLSAIINLPKGTEFFLSDIHGEYEAFLHIMNNCSGVIKEKVDLIFKDTISDYDRQELCTLIYYPREKMALLDEQGKIDSDWYAMTLNQLKVLFSQRQKVVLTLAIG